MDKIDAIATFRSLMPEPETVGFYDPAEHDGVVLEDLPDDWRCPRCKLFPGLFFCLKNLEIMTYYKLYK